jgi:organic hydroperoxide reductase OsmC/OhrA
VSEHRITLNWKRTTPDFDYKSYTRDHTVKFKNGTSLGMSAAPTYMGNPAQVDPEEMLVASLSSCHMLTFLAIAAKKKLMVDGYEDDAVGILAKNADGRLAITQVTLRPRVTFSGEQPDDATLEQMHHDSHEQCFIANSVNCEMHVEPQEVVV